MDIECGVIFIAYIEQMHKQINLKRQLGIIGFVLVARRHLTEKNKMCLSTLSLFSFVFAH